MNSLGRNITRRFLGYLPFITCFIILFFSQIFRVFTFWNLITQFLLFLFIVSIPALITKRMSYVDIAWPWGLVCIGVLSLYLGQGYWLKKIIISIIYIITGLRMGIGALILYKKGHLDKELSRYRFQRIRWKKFGYKSEHASLQYEIMLQCISNITFLAIPAMLQAYNPDKFISIYEILGYILWISFIIIEHFADIQKQKFIKKSYLNNQKKAVCNVGLWKYSRHPNYFAEWMVWNSIIISSISSLSYYFETEHKMIAYSLLFCLLYISRLMYKTLVFYTGAIPSEYYSIKKRGEYIKYQKVTNMFFPGIKKNNNY